MSNTENFIDEVTEEVRRERIFHLFRRYGWIGGVVVAAIVGGAAWNEYQKSQADARAQAFGGAVLTALEAGDATARHNALSQVAASGDAGAMTRLLAATEALNSVESALTTKALADLAAVAEDQSVSQVWRDLAQLRRLTAPGGGDLAGAERSAALSALSAPGRPFRPLALEQLALEKVAAGDKVAALADFRALVDDREAPSALRARAEQMIVILGGDSVPVQD